MNKKGLKFKFGWISVVVIGLMLVSGCENINKGDIYNNVNNEVDLAESEGEENLIGETDLQKNSQEDYLDKIQTQWFENVAIKDGEIKEAPGEEFSTVNKVHYGDIVFVNGIYEDWYRVNINKNDTDGWIKTESLLEEKFHKDYNFGIITAEEVKVGNVFLKKGNLVQILKRDSNKSCVTIRVIDVSGGKTGWIDNDTYTTQFEGAFFNQAYLKKQALIYSEPNEKSDIVSHREMQFFFVGEEMGDWVKISSYGPVDGWTKKENLVIPKAMSETEKTTVMNVVQGYFDAFEKMDYETMKTLGTKYHNENFVHDGDVWGMKWAKIKEIDGLRQVVETFNLGVLVECETVKTSAQYPTEQSFFFLNIVFDEQMKKWLINTYSTSP